jgi:hypothetical protein
MKKISITTAQYFILGPLIGAICTALFGLFSVVKDSVSFGEIAASVVAFPILLLVGVPFAFLFGGVQSMFVGFATGLAEKNTGLTAIWIPIFASIVAWLGFATYSHFTENTNWQNSFASGNAAAWFFVHVAAAAGTWLLLNSWGKRRAQ